MRLISSSRKATTKDLPSIVSLHVSVFRGFFLTLLGRRFLSELYRGFIAEQDGICRVIEAELQPGQAAVVGFVAGTVRPEIFFRRLLFRRGMFFACAAVPGLLKHPMLVFPRLVNAIRYRGARPPSIEHAALLSSIGVDPKVARLGFGRMLVDIFCEDAVALGARAVYLTTAQQGNDSVNTFYDRAGFRLLAAKRSKNGRVMNTYWRPIERLGRGENDF